MNKREEAVRNATIAATKVESNLLDAHEKLRLGLHVQAFQTIHASLEDIASVVAHLRQEMFNG